MEYWKQDARLLLAYFEPSYFSKERYQKVENIFSRKKSSSIIFSNFSNSLLLKNFIIKAEKTFLRNQTTWYAFYSKSATFNVFEKNQVIENPIHLFKKNEILNVLRILTISVLFHGKFA